MKNIKTGRNNHSHRRVTEKDGTLLRDLFVYTFNQGHINVDIGSPSLRDHSIEARGVRRDWRRIDWALNTNFILCIEWERQWDIT